MNGRRGQQWMPMATAIAVVFQLVPMMLMPAGFSALAADDLQGVGLDIAMRPKQAVSARKADDTAYVMQQLDESDRSIGTSTPTLQGSVTSVRVTRGRSQIVKFAQPIMRISIAEPTVADVIPLSPDQIMINGKLRGVTSLIVWDENGQEGIFDLYVQNDTSELLDAVKAIAPNEKIQARVTDDSFILSGQVSSTVVLDEIRKTAAAYGFRKDQFVDLTDTPVPQVILEVKIAEIRRSVLRNLNHGFAFNNLGRTGKTTLAGSRFDTLGTEDAPGRLGSLPQLLNPSVGGLTNAIIHQAGNLQLMHRFDLLETSGKINLLANPTLVCTHGRTADFLAGGEFPFVGAVDQNGSPIISFKEFGVKLKFTPWISVKSGRVELKVEPEVSSLDTTNCVAAAAGTQVCGIAKRRTETTVELQDNESLMISGILTRDEQNTFSKTPFIGNVPVLGNLFKSADMNKQDRELVVIITPRIVKPTDYGRVLGSAQ